MTEIIRVAERCARQKLKHVEKVKCVENLRTLLKRVDSSVFLVRL